MKVIDRHTTQHRSGQMTPPNSAAAKKNETIVGMQLQVAEPLNAL